MKKMITALAACGVLLGAAAPAQAVPDSPVRALRSVLAPGHGVHLAETVTLLEGPVERAERRREGVFELNAKGHVDALDVSTVGGEDGRERVIGRNYRVGGTAYYSGGYVGERLKALKNGKTWLRREHQLYLHYAAMLGDDVQLINPAEPATLAALLKHGQVEGNTVTGRITSGQLAKVSVWFDRLGHSSWDAMTISYTLTLTSTGLVSRVQSAYTVTDPYIEELVGKTLHADTRYSRWGEKVSIKMPDRRRTTYDLCAAGRTCDLVLPG